MKSEIFLWQEFQDKSKWRGLLSSVSIIGPPLDYSYGYPVMSKRVTRPTLSEYLRLAAIQYELDKEEAEAADAQSAGTIHCKYNTGTEYTFYLPFFSTALSL